MNKMVRLGLVGLGGMGQHHAANLAANKVPRLKLAAVCDTDPGRCARFPDLPAFSSVAEMAASGTVEAVLVATPHYHHTPIAIAAIEAGLHVLVEKPIAVHKADAERLLATPVKPGQLVAAMFNQRTDDFFLKIRETIQRRELGELRRMNWIITDWFRTDRYYALGGWRATWGGEGGGVLLNQCPHNLDLVQWIFGLPVRVRAFCGFGRYHPIEVEDDVSAFFEFANGATGIFVTSTGEAPGTNRLEIVGERGRLVYEADRIAFKRNAVPMTEFSRQATEGFARPASEEVTIAAAGHGDQHIGILKNFADAILDGVPLIAPVADGIRSLELANAMLLSAWTGETVSLPLDGALYERRLKQKIAESPRN